MGPKIGRRHKYWYLKKQLLKEKESVSTETALGTFFCIAGIEAGHMYMYMLVMVHAATKSCKLSFGFYPHTITCPYFPSVVCDVL